MIRKILSLKALFMVAAAILMAAAPATTLHAQEKSEQQQIAEAAEDLRQIENPHIRSNRYQQAVQRHPTLSQIIKRLAEGRTGHANFLRLCYGKLHTAHPVLPTRFFSKAINAGSPGMMGSYPLLKISTLGKSSVSAPACLACRYSA